jgi:predicted molibdopterin-dependent oxidoreductase YjgC
VYQFHTRTKTGRARQLREAAPEPWVEVSVADAQRLGVREGDLVRVASRRGEIDVRARVGDVREGTVFAPFHYGYWDLGTAEPAPGVPPRAANELTMTVWDVISKQPVLKTAAVRLQKLADGDGRPSAAPTTAASRPASRRRDAPAVPPTRGGQAAMAGSEVLARTPHYPLDPAQGAEPVTATRTLTGPAGEARP